MRRSSAIAVVALALTALGGGLWLVLGQRPNVPIQVAQPEHAEQDTSVASERHFELPPEPEPPAPGTPERRIFFGALIAGDERSLSAVREALSVAKVAQGPNDSVYLDRLRAMEEVYVERLSRHRLEVARP